MVGVYPHWGTPVYGFAFLYTEVPQHVGMHSHLLGYPSIWGCIPIYWGTPVYAGLAQGDWARRERGREFVPNQRVRRAKNKKQLQPDIRVQLLGFG
jgi:hypothetical protein